jgi:hypothetical protein
MGSDAADRMNDQQALVKMAREGVAIVSKTIGAPAFTGVGLNDMTNGGEYTGDVDIEYEVEIDGTGTPDTIKWSKDGVVQTPATINIDGTDQTLDNGVTIKFNATTGHTLADKWTFTARATDPTSIQKNVITPIAASLLGGVSITSPAIDLRNVQSAGLTVKCDFDAAAIAGCTVEIFTSADGVNYDVDPWASTGLEPTFVANTTAQKSSNLDTEPIAFMKIKVTNDELVESLGSLTVKVTRVEV